MKAASFMSDQSPLTGLCNIYLHKATAVTCTLLNEHTEFICTHYTENNSTLSEELQVKKV